MDAIAGSSSTRAGCRRWPSSPPGSPTSIPDAGDRRTSSILHNDFKIDNCQFDPADPDRVHSIFDWDMATLGDPLVDLGTLLNYWPDPADPDDDRPLHVPGLEHMGLPSRAEVVARYAERTGFDVASVRLVRGVRHLEDRASCSSSCTSATCAARAPTRAWASAANRSPGSPTGPAPMLDRL